jgi:hypothetical protein
VGQVPTCGGLPARLEATQQPPTAMVIQRAGGGVASFIQIESSPATSCSERPCKHKNTLTQPKPCRYFPKRLYTLKRCNRPAKPKAANQPTGRRPPPTSHAGQRPAWGGVASFVQIQNSFATGYSERLYTTQKQPDAPKPCRYSPERPYTLTRCIRPAKPPGGKTHWHPES